MVMFHHEKMGFEWIYSRFMIATVSSFMTRLTMVHGFMDVQGIYIYIYIHFLDIS